MTFLVASCNHWIGFHIVNALLEEGYEVDGVSGEAGNENLPMFFGRNSLFTMVNANERKDYDIVIIIDETLNMERIESKRIIKIGEISDGSENTVHIKNLLLYGEWMAMNEKGIYSNNEFIPFNSKTFQDEAIYIKDFTKALIQWLKTDELPSNLHVKSSKNKDDKGLKLENTIYLRDNIPKEEKLKTVLTHYKEFIKLYE
ncbi:hypothetical protein CIL05_12475 [Virgibacillus profundi]|uniref:Uncharacterized protein n=1 Tax=Virgibacillus profundi TaxID=2024555 RepID=A0A2A2ID12_9BACI|nr:hypothetical protein [Virgibacillus profundi]PAV29206.1 hypothetical protein CIL05_12475 [Virgibacillus profundi]PXY53375.1 hypothetical protein CIT14_12600 [Virgibacillus profundi]